MVVRPGVLRGRFEDNWTKEFVLQRKKGVKYLINVSIKCRYCPTYFKIQVESVKVNSLFERDRGRLYV